MNLLWLKNINKEGMAMLGMKYDRSVWKRYDDDLCVCGTKGTEIHVLLECKCYDMVRRRWLRTCDVLEEKERTMDIIKR